MDIKDFLLLPREEQKDILRKYKRISEIELEIGLIKEARKELEVRLAEAQDACDHYLATETYRSDTGNYDKSQDQCWIEYKCPTCGKVWVEDQ